MFYCTDGMSLFFVSAKLEGEHFFNGVPKLCQIIANLCTISCVTSLMTIATMSFNRYIYVCRSDYYHIIFSKQNSIIICCFLYCIGLILVLLNQAGIGDHTFDRKSLECIWDRMATFSYTVVFSVTLVWIPCLIIGVCYLKLYLFVRRHKKKVNNHRSGITNLVVPTIPSKPQPQLGKTFVLIYAVFVICWAPYALLIVLDLEDSFPHEIHLYITMFAHLHPSINWLIYYLTHRKISLAYCRLLGIKKGNTSTFSKNFTFGDDRGSKIQVKEELNNPGGNNNREIERDSVQNDPALVSKTNIVAKSEVGACYQDNVEKSENSGIDCKVCGKSQNSQRVKNAQEPIHEAKVSVELHLSVSFHNDSSPADITEELNQISQAENGSKILKNSKSQDLFHKQISDPDVDITGGTSKYDNSDSLMTCIQDVNVTELERYTTVELTKAVTAKTS